MSDENPKPEEKDAKPEDGDAKAKDSGTKDKDAEKKPPAKSGPPWYKRPLIVGILLLVLAILIVGGLILWRHSRSHVTSDDAYVDGVPQLVSPQVAGRVLKVLVDDNQDVTAGQELVQIDPADFQSRVDQAEAAAAQARAQLAEAHAQQTVYQSQVQESEASLGTATANATNASNQLGRYRRLKAVNAGAVSDQQMDSAVAADTSTSAQRQAAEKAVDAANAQLGYSRSMIQAAEAGIGSANSQVALARLTLSYTHVVAAMNGRIANKTVAPGNIVAAGAPLMAVVPRDVYVTANLKETQLNHIQKGQPVAIKVDAYPDLKVTGKIDSVEPASGQTFSIIPAQNATGNWVKVVQRVPVKILFDQIPDDPNRRLAPGMSVEISAKVR
ncbi:MAG TPA: HlyD family secretion protein [Opitutaceae bacterium]|jgi:membrane fusion protein (multidrug efflux system)|nr:HlyD family secretion protein [Opitutaceae bacterium]